MHSSTSSAGTVSREEWLGVFAAVMFPTVAACIALAPVISLGPLDFAMSQSFDLNVSAVGISFGLCFAAAAVLAGGGGVLASRFDPTKVVRVGLVASSAIAGGMAIANSVPFVMVCAILAGAVNGLATPSMNLMITSRVPERRRGLAFGLKVGAVPAMATIAAVGGYAVATTGAPWQVVLWVCAAVGLLSAGLSLMDRQSRAPRRATGRLRARRTNLRPPVSLVLLSVGGFLGSTATALIAAFLVDGLIDRGEAPDRASVIVVIVGWAGIVSRVGVGLLSDRWPDARSHLRTAAVLLLFASSGMVGLGLGHGEWLLSISAFLAACIGWAWPGLVHHAAIVTHHERAASATSLMQTGTFAGSFIGPFIFGLIAQHAGFSSAWMFTAMSAVAAATLLFLGVAAIGRHPSGLGEEVPYADE